MAVAGLIEKFVQCSGLRIENEKTRFQTDDRQPRLVEHDETDFFGQLPETSLSIARAGPEQPLAHGVDPPDMAGRFINRRTLAKHRCRDFRVVKFHGRLIEHIHCELRRIGKWSPSGHPGVRLTSGDN